MHVTSEPSNAEAGREVQVSWGCLHECGRQDEEPDTRIDKGKAVMRALLYAVVMKRELSKKAKLSIFKAVFVSILTMVMNLLGNGRKSAISTASVRNVFFYKESKELHYLTRCVAPRFENLLTSSRYFSELKHLS